MKKKVGRPAKYQSVDEMEPLIEQYFQQCDVPSLSGLALALGFAYRKSLNDYVKKPEFSYALKRAKTRVEAYWESRLYYPNPRGAIFWLKNNAGWK